MSLNEFADFAYDVSSEDYYDLDGYEELDLGELEDGEELTGKPIATFYPAKEDYQSDSMRFFLLSKADDGLPIKIKFYCQIPKPVGWTPDNKYPLCNLFRNNKYERNTYNIIYSILKLQGFKNINDDDGNPVNSFKNVSAQAYLDILSEQDEITIKVVGTGNEHPYNNTLEIVNISDKK